MVAAKRLEQETTLKHARLAMQQRHYSRAQEFLDGIGAKYRSFDDDDAFFIPSEPGLDGYGELGRLYR